MNSTASSTRWLAILMAVVVLSSACGGSGAGSVTTTDRWESIGNPNADVVVVNAQGGPTPQLETGEFAGIFGSVDDESVLVLNVHQVQTLDPDRFTAADLTFDEAITADQESVALLAAVVDEFQGQGKLVYVVGISFGAFIVQELLVTQGNVADGYLIEVGRLAMPDEVWMEFAEGRFAGFADGTDVLPVPIEEAGMGAGSPAGDRNMARLAAGLGQRRYLELLNNIDLSNVIYAYGETDEQVGRLTDAEVEFLNDHDAMVLVGNGGHGDTIDQFTNQALRTLLGSDFVS